MSAEDIAICSICQMTFGSHEEVLLHTCVEMKEEKMEVEEMISDEENNQVECDIFGNIKNSKKNNGVKIKVKTNEYQDEEQNNDNFALSEQFIMFIIQQVDELCENIKTGDPDIKRTEEVTKNLNDAVDCYRNKLDSDKKLFVKIENVKNYDEMGITSDNENNSKDFFRSKLGLVKEIFVESEHHNNIVIESGNDSDTKDILHKSKIPKKAKKSKAPNEKNKVGEDSKAIINENIQPEINHCDRPGQPLSLDEKFELVKNQCGRHDLLSIAKMLNLHSSRLKLRIKKEGIIFSKKLMECQLCEMKRNTLDVKKDVLLPFLRFNSNESKFECSICNYSASGRHHLYTHIRSKHVNEIVAKALPDRMSENKLECDGSVCKKVYGVKGQKKWCNKCVKDLQIAEEKRKAVLAGVCPECGLLENNLNAHIKNVHHGEKQVCSLCSHECGSLKMLYEHNRAVHEKVPCTECGKLFGLNKIKLHIKSAHTPDDQKKYRCDTCGKGFIDNWKLSDHMNVHTGEKPHKCKFCSASFASRGTHAMHERGHVGRGRKNYK